MGVQVTEPGCLHVHRNLKSQVLPGTGLCGLETWERMNHIKTFAARNLPVTDLLFYSLTGVDVISFHYRVELDEDGQINWEQISLSFSSVENLNVNDFVTQGTVEASAWGQCHDDPQTSRSGHRELSHHVGSVVTHSPSPFTVVFFLPQPSGGHPSKESASHIASGQLIRSSISTLASDAMMTTLVLARDHS